jgi:hypothetical protein
MTLRNPGRLAIYRRSDEIAFLQHRLRVIGETQFSGEAGDSDSASRVLARERDLADEFLHTRQTEPLGETLQRRLAMAELVCHDLALRDESLSPSPTFPSSPSAPVGPEGDHAGRAPVQRNRGSGPERESRQSRLPDAYWVAEIERWALNEMLNQWWAWLRKS